MTVVVLNESSVSAKPAWRWIALLLLLLAASLIALTVYGVVYERETKILVSEAKVEAQLQAAVLKSELEKQRSVPVILAMDTDLVENSKGEATFMVKSKRYGHQPGRYQQKDQQNRRLPRLSSEHALTSTNYAVLFLLKI